MSRKNFINRQSFENRFTLLIETAEIKSLEDGRDDAATRLEDASPLVRRMSSRTVEIVSPDEHEARGLPAGKRAQESRPIADVSCKKRLGSFHLQSLQRTMRRGEGVIFAPACLTGDAALVR